MLGIIAFAFAKGLVNGWANVDFPSMISKAKTVQAYLQELPEDRKKAISKVRKIIRMRLPKGYAEVMQYGMITYVVPLRLYPQGYLNDKNRPLPYVGLASQKNYMAVYLMCIYGPEGKWFEIEYKKTGKKLDMGKCCIRFKKIEDLPLELIGDAVARVPVETFIERYEAGRAKKRSAY